MAQFSAQGGMKLLFNGDRAAFSIDHRNSFHFRNSDGKSIQNPFSIRKNRLGSDGLSRICSTGERSSNFSSKENLNDVADSSDDVWDYEYERDELSCFRGLVLDISYRPVNVVCWRRAICLEFTEKADVLEYYDQTVSSSRGPFYIPAVLRVPHLLQVVKRRRIKQSLSRKNIFSRDSYMCQYCSSRNNLTIDHILPVSLGGEWKWENLVTACANCNSRKGQKTLDEANMKLIRNPKAPKEFDILAIPLTNSAIKSLGMRKGMPEEWRQYLSKPDV